MKRTLILSLSTAFVAAPIHPAAASAFVTSSAQDPSSMSEEEKSELAKTYYIEAQSAFKAGDYLTAMTKYEEAYFLVPGKHGFAFKVGTAAWKLGDCVKADEYFRHYVTYETRDSKADKIEEAKKILGEIALSGCANVEEENPIAATTETAAPEEDDAPDLSSQRQQRESNGDSEEIDEGKDEDKDKMEPMLIAGIGLSVVGVAGLAVGVTGMVLGNSAANSLVNSSSNNTNTGFPEGYYSDEATFNRQASLKGYNGMTVGGLVGGGVFLAAGATLIALGIVNKKQAQASSEPAPAPEAEAETAGLQYLSPVWMRNGAGASASFKF